MKLFPTFKKLAEAPQTEVLRAWKGLGYNSRALRLKKTAEIITRDYHGKFPKTYEELILLPGIGPYTAGALCAFAYNQPVTMIETNIRRVYLHHFYPSPLREVPLNKGSQDIDTTSVHDRELLQLIQQTLDDEHSREWYWALMDYGAYLGKTIPNPNKKSRHYTIQKKFEGSDRQLRGKILEFLLAQKNHRLTMVKIQKLLESLTRDGDRIEIILDQLSKDGFLEIAGNSIRLKK
jgi:A/G-specific adenine glycosylase